MFLAAHDSRIKGKMFKTVASIPEISNNAVSKQIFLNLEDSLDWINTAGNNGVTRRITYSYGDLSGMDRIPVQTCVTVNDMVDERLMAMFKVCRDNFPLSLHGFPR